MGKWPDLLGDSTSGASSVRHCFPFPLPTETEAEINHNKLLPRWIHSKGFQGPVNQIPPPRPFNIPAKTTRSRYLLSDPRSNVREPQCLPNLPRNNFLAATSIRPIDTHCHALVNTHTYHVQPSTLRRLLSADVRDSGGLPVGGPGGPAIGPAPSGGRDDRRCHPGPFAARVDFPRTIGSTVSQRIAQGSLRGISTWGGTLHVSCRN